MKHVLGKSSMAAFFYLFLMLASSCNKEQTSERRIATYIKDSTLAHDLSTGSVIKKGTPKSIRDIIKGVDQKKLKKFVTKVKNKYKLRTLSGFFDIPVDVALEEEAAQILRPVNAEILNHLSQTYPQFGPSDMVDVNDPDFTYFASVYDIGEAVNFVLADIPILDSGANLIVSKGVPVWLRCAIDIVGGYFDISSIVKSLGTFEFGAVWPAIKFCIKRYVGWVAAAVLIYDITTECL